MMHDTVEEFGTMGYKLVVVEKKLKTKLDPRLAGVFQSVCLRVGEKVERERLLEKG